ncbi:PREDICTED: probable ATP-dependent DNA helicase DDX11 [Dufourea novaeangliae]|uniref:probable ATP-dependent DNA helicase DDX11 n=1 Tax=Dufourea novaeangliae TaxID=178035 RepID=UPI000766F8F9|nr:PREDICTED: probable ATP-dependent DNA helicase DDX11 [Dufourea novaeangliae]
MQSNEEFPFPFPPYPIQNQFMKELYKCLENANLGIFESPTGTGKSMSIICGAVKWLIDHEELQKNLLNSEIAELDEKIKKYSNTSDDWVFVQTEQMQLNTKRQALQTKLNSILQYERKKNALKETIKNVNNRKKLNNRKKTSNTKQGKETNELPVDKLDVPAKSIEEELLLEDIIETSDNSEGEEEEEEIYENTKIFFCSRTHSQLSQFIGELKKSPYSKLVSVITLASRQNYCINTNIRRLKHLNLMNEHCLQLQKKKTTTKEEKDLKRKKIGTSCPFMPGDQDLLIGETLTQIQDVEEIAQKGENIKTCAYYASRKAIPHGQLILVPYNSILHKNTRNSSEIKLKGNILIIDEAHNLLDAIERMHSVMVTGRNILHCYSQLTQYQTRFQALFSAKSVLYLSQLSFYLRKLLTIFGATSKSNPNDDLTIEVAPKLYKLEEFEVMTEIDTVNVFELLKFIKNSRLSHKLQGFMEQYGNQVKIHKSSTKTSGVTQFLSSIKSKSSEPNESDTVTKTVSDEQQSNNPLISIVSFLECLQNSCSDGRIFIVPGLTVGQSVVKFLLLNPAAHFYDIVRDARSIILAGGTMEPMDEFTEQLFIAAGAAPERIITFSCNHVVPQENIACSIVSRGPTGIEFEFNFKNQQNTNLLNELGRALVNICNIVPAGIVVFLPSYNFEELMYKHFDKSGVITKISSKKCIFRETKSASQVNEILEQYALCVKKPKSPKNGSLLFSVVGGKLSEGLNFSDDLGRCVIVVGMPYPNITSLELQEKMKYLNENIKPNAGQNFYENACMKAVNQCIGRAIRHINDYSTVLLFDKRYSKKIKTLPQWIQSTVTVHETFGTMIGSLAKFFIKKRNKSTTNYN